MSTSYFTWYMQGVSKLAQVVQDLEKICTRMLQVKDIARLHRIYNYDCNVLFNRANDAIRDIDKYDFTKHNYRVPTRDEREIYEKICNEQNAKVAKLWESYQEYKKLCVTTYSYVLNNLVGNVGECIIMDNGKFKLVVEKLKAEAKIKEANAMIAAAEKAKADLAIEEHKTEQLRLQAEERKAREEEAILSVEERCRIMYNEFLETLQGGIVNPTR